VGRLHDASFVTSIQSISQGELPMAFSVLILTHNEEANIGPCLDSLKAAADGLAALDIAVLDSGSSDTTGDIVRGQGIRVYSRRFDDFASQRNWGADSIPWAFDWILHLDADERVSRDLVAEIIMETPESTQDAYLLASRLFFMGRWIRYSSRYPYFQARLLHRRRARFVSRGHGQYLDDAARKVGRLRQPYDHFNFSKGVSEWVDKHNRYSTAEALQNTGSRSSFRAAIARFVTAHSREASQQALKDLAAAIPFRPLVKFLYLYIWKWGFLDGRPGFNYCLLMAFYEVMIDMKRQEIAEDDT